MLALAVITAWLSINMMIELILEDKHRKERQAKRRKKTVKCYDYYLGEDTHDYQLKESA